MIRRRRNTTKPGSTRVTSWRWPCRRLTVRAVAAKQRADQLLVEQGLAESRTKAQALILAGLVSCGERRVDKPGEQLAPDAALSLKGRDHPWVSRGGAMPSTSVTGSSPGNCGRILGSSFWNG